MNEITKYVKAELRVRVAMRKLNQARRLTAELERELAEAEASYIEFGGEQAEVAIELIAEQMRHEVAK